MSTAVEEVSAPLTANSATFPLAKDTNPFVKNSPFPLSEIAAAAEDEAPPEPEEEPQLEDAGTSEEVAAEPETQEENPLVQEAVERMGISKAVAESLGDELLDLLAAYDKQAAELYASSQPKTEQPKPEPPVKLPSTEQAEVKTPVPPAFEKIKLELDPDEYDEGQIKTFQTLVDKFNSQQEVIQVLAQLAVSTHDSLNQTTGQQQAEAEVQYERLADSFFANLGDAFTDTFGKQPVKQLTTESPLFKSRLEVVEQARVQREVDARKGRQLKSDEEYLNRAVRALHTDKLKQLARKEVETEVAQRRKQAIQRPSGHNKRPATVKERAIQVIADKMRQMGITPEED